MTKQEFVDQVASNSGLSKGDAGKAVDSVLQTIQETLSRGGEISFTGFGKFTVADRGARQGVNPQTGERIQIAASRVPRFSAGSQLKAAVKGSGGGGGGNGGGGDGGGGDGGGDGGGFGGGGGF